MKALYDRLLTGLFSDHFTGHELPLLVHFEDCDISVNLYELNVMGP